jgi:uncharacterized protein (TIGR02453 family)
VPDEAFNGFGPETFAFLRDLGVHNNRDWFTANRADYEQHYLAPALAFISEIGPRLAAELPGGVQFEPRVNGSLFRINRDVRFSKDKAPYKDRIDVWFWTGGNKGWETPGYFMRLQADRWAIGAGVHHFGKDGLEVYRNSVVDEVKGKALEAAVARIGRTYEVGIAVRKTVPRGYDAGHPRAAFLLHEGLVAVLERALPKQVASSGFVDYCVAHFKAVSPVNDWLRSILAPEM